MHVADSSCSEFFAACWLALGRALAEFTVAGEDGAWSVFVRLDCSERVTCRLVAVANISLAVGLTAALGTD